MSKRLFELDKARIHAFEDQIRGALLPDGTTVTSIRGEPAVERATAAVKFAMRVLEMGGATDAFQALCAIVATLQRERMCSCAKCSTPAPGQLLS